MEAMAEVSLTYWGLGPLFLEDENLPDEQGTHEEPRRHLPTAPTTPQTARSSTARTIPSPSVDARPQHLSAPARSPVSRKSNAKLSQTCDSPAAALPRRRATTSPTRPAPSESLAIGTTASISPPSERNSATPAVSHSFAPYR